MSKTGQIGVILGGIASILGMVGGVIAMRFSFITFVILLILQLTSLIAIGWWVIGTPLLMLLGGFVALMVSGGILAVLAD